MENIDLACPLCAMRIAGTEAALEKDRTCPRCKEWVKFVRSEEVPEVHDGKPEVAKGTYSKAFAYGSVVALIGATLWALLGAVFYIEIGWLAWGIGASIGWVVAVVGMHGMANKGIMACGLTAASLLMAKVIFLALSIPIEVGNLWATDVEMRETMVYTYMVSTGEVKDFEIEGDAEDWDDESLDLYAENQAKLDAKMNSLTEDDKDAIKSHYAEILDQSIPFGVKMGMVFSFWDLLWFGLALSSAFKIAESREQRNSFS